MRSTRFSFSLCLAIFSLLSVGAATARGPAPETFFPRAGNPGYDALSYHVDLAYRPRSGRIDATTTIEATASQELTRFSLDFSGPRVRQVLVGGQAAGYRRAPGKLKVVPEAKIEAGARFTAVVSYEGTPPKIVDPDGTSEGWLRTDDGVIAVGEPQGTPAWIPCNNLPADKATFEFELTVPDELKAIANGRRLRSVNRGAAVAFRWIERAPMSPYLAVLNIGRGRVVKSRIGRIPAWTLVDPRMERAARKPLSALPQVLRFQSRLFGGYPFESAGSIVDYAPRVGYALETQSRPIYTYVPSRTLVVHEVAHQWFGNSVGLERWPEIWLNEGLATWTQWYYAERHGGRGAAEVFRRLRRLPAGNELWNPPPGRPGSPKRLFAPSVYVRGAMAVQALRQKIGTETLLRVLRQWTTDHRHGSATIKEFVVLAEKLSDRNLDPLFRRWLYQRGKPR